MTAQCHKAIGDFYFGPSFYRKDNNEMEKCFEHYGAARTLMRNLGVGDHKESILTLKNYGVCCKSKENYHEAISVLTKAKQVADIELEEDHKWKVMIETQLALVYDCAGNAEKAEQIMGKALNMNKRLKQSISQLANKKRDLGIPEASSTGLPKASDEDEFSKLRLTTVSVQLSCSCS